MKERANRGPIFWHNLTDTARNLPVSDGHEARNTDDTAFVKSRSCKIGDCDIVQTLTRFRRCDHGDPIDTMV